LVYDRRMPLELDDDVVLHRLSLDDYHRLIDAGLFEDRAPFELIDGLLVEMSPISEAHKEAVWFLTEWLVLGVDRERYQAGAGGPLTLEAAGSEPEPDLSVIERTVHRPYHPASAVLVIEVSLTSLRYDLGAKARLYGAAGIEEYWVVDLHGRCVWVHRSPQPGGGFGTRAKVGEGQQVQATALALPPLAVSELMAAAHRSRG
jgi:Uma2 family endonuclease